MKAVNLIPSEEARHGGHGGGGLPTYAVLGVLAMLVAMSAIYTLAGRSVDSRRAGLAQVTAQKQAAEARARDLKPYSDFATMGQARVETVKSLVQSRFDWPHSLREVARTLPAGAWITSLRATVNPQTAVEGTNDTLRPALAVPAIELTGCASDHRGVARTVTSLRRMTGVQRVSLSSSKKSGEAAASSQASGVASAEGCGARPAFSLTIFYKAPATAPAQPAAPTAAGAKP
jgi:Tfp pilus assembly protein PilN